MMLITSLPASVIRGRHERPAWIVCRADRVKRQENLLHHVLDVFGS
jgi:hypothetical protein